MNERVSLICLGSCVVASLNVRVAMIAIQDEFPDVERRLAGFITLYAGEISGIRSMAKCYYSSFYSINQREQVLFFIIQNTTIKLMHTVTQSEIVFVFVL